MSDCLTIYPGGANAGAPILIAIGDRLVNIRNTLNRWLCYEPILLIGGTALLIQGMHYFCNKVPKDGTIAAVRRSVIKVARKIPSIQKQIEGQIQDAQNSITDDMVGLFKGNKGDLSFITKMPCDGLDRQDIINLVAEYLELGHFKWDDGAVSGTVYHGGKDLTELNAKVYQMSTWTNPLHPDVFPGVCKMESEIVRISADLFHGDSNSCGSVTSGGTESIILAVKAYRDYATKYRGIKNPEILIPVTAHAAFDKAAMLLNIGIKHVPINENSCTVDVSAMKKMITKNTIMLVGSAPAFPHGCIDDIEAIAKLGEKYNIPVHTDACLGGFLLAFMPSAGFDIPNFDFKLPGVTSISADTHKYGFAPKGSSVLLFREKKYKHCQYFVTPDWPGGLYASPTLAGSRPGSILAGCWATLLYFGMAGYVETTKQIITNTRWIEQELRKVKGIRVMGRPQVSVIALASNDFDIYKLQDALKKKGWSLNPLQFPSCIHFCMTYCQTEPGVAERFVKDTEMAVEEIMKNPGDPTPTAAAIYGTSQTVPDRSIVTEITTFYMDTLYETNFSSHCKSTHPNATVNSNDNKSPPKNSNKKQNGNKGHKK